MIVLHAVTPDTAPGVAAPGVAAVAERRGLQAYGAHGLVVLHREQPAAPARESVTVLAFGEVLRELAAEGTVLPMRFGSVVADRAALAALAEEQHQVWNDLLSTLAGRVELIVHVPDAPRPEVSASGSGREYLAARAAAVHAAEEQLAEIGRLAAVEAVRPLPRQRVSLLVAAADQVSARREVAGWARRRGLGDLAVTGPWPPFSFCEEGPR